MDREKDIEYTIVMDPGYLGPAEESRDTGAEAPEKGAASDRKAADRLYSEYEKMCYKLPTVLDADDAYPHSYQWRIVDKYAPSKLKVVEEALSLGVKIADTEAYASYVEEVKASGIELDPWE